MLYIIYLVTREDNLDKIKEDLEDLSTDELIAKFNNRKRRR